MAKVAKFAPSLANLFMVKWEEEVIYAYRRPEVFFWGRYLDDILLLWNDTLDSLHLYMTALNDTLSFETSLSEIHFLDLIIKMEHEISEIGH